MLWERPVWYGVWGVYVVVCLCEYNKYVVGKHIYVEGICVMCVLCVYGVYWVYMVGGVCTYNIGVSRGVCVMFICI